MSEYGLAFQAKSTLCGDGEKPVPTIEAVVREFAPVLFRVRIPVPEPDDWGLKIRVIEVLPPAAIVVGRDIPLIENSLLLMFADDTVTGPADAERVTV
jgi:hypothetical protein